MKRNLKFTKIVATISGKDSTRELIADLYARGMNVVRLNTAHMKIEELEKVLRWTREVAPDLAVMVDTKGPNIRTQDVPDAGLALHAGDTVRISGKPGQDCILVNYPPFASEVPIGSRIVFDDGAAKFSVVGKTADYLEAEVLFDCVVLPRKSVNVPDVSLKAPALTEKDREFLAAAVRLKCDWIAHSFVRNAEDVTEVRNALGEAGKEIGIIAKIENREGVNNIKEILEAADGIMVARGDLGIEIPLEEVPAIQKQLIHAARMAAKPVITATQMLQSMEHSPAPTRAEVSDVANAVYDGTDAVMLSGETAHGDYPREAVEVMAKIVEEAERAPRQFFTQLDTTPDWNPEAAYMLAAAVNSAEYLPVKAIFCNTMNGLSAKVCSALRPQIPIIALTPMESSMHKLAVSYGVFAMPSRYADSPMEQMQQILDKIDKTKHSLKPDDLVMILGKSSTSVKRNNMLCMASLKELAEVQARFKEEA